MMLVAIIYTTISREKAEYFAEKLLESRTVACVVMLDAKSMYWWKGRIAKENEIVLLCKTVGEKAEKAMEEIKKLHPYDVPCILHLSAEANDEYAKWLEDETQ